MSAHPDRLDLWAGSSVLDPMPAAEDLAPGGQEADGSLGAETSGGSEPRRRPRQLPSWLPRRILPGVWFPLAVWAVWRGVHLGLLRAHGGALVETAYLYDGAHYLRLLHYGYWHPRPLMPSHAFFPGLSWVATPVYWLTGSDAITVHVVATVTAIAAFVAVWAVTKEWKGERAARLAVVLMAGFPSSVFLWAFYSEALFIALGAGAVWADRRGMHGIAVACLLGVATTRSVGILVPMALIAARWWRLRHPDRWTLIYAAAGAAGFCLVLLTMWHQTGDPFSWTSVQGDWGREVAWPWQSVVQGIENLNPRPGTEMVPALVARQYDLFCVPVVLAALLYAGFSRRDRFPAEVWMLGVALIGVQLCSAVLASFNRFVLADWVIYAVYAAILLRLWRWSRPAAYVVGGILAVGSLWATSELIDLLSVNGFIG